MNKTPIDIASKLWEHLILCPMIYITIAFLHLFGSFQKKPKFHFTFLVGYASVVELIALWLISSAMEKTENALGYFVVFLILNGIFTLALFSLIVILLIGLFPNIGKRDEDPVNDLLLMIYLFWAGYMEVLIFWHLLKGRTTTQQVPEEPKSPVSAENPQLQIHSKDDKEWSERRKERQESNGQPKKDNSKSKLHEKVQMDKARAERDRKSTENDRVDEDNERLNEVGGPLNPPLQMH